MVDDREEPSDIIREADRIVLTRQGPVGVLVNDDLEILQFRGDVSPYLAPVSGRASLNVLRMARESLTSDVEAALREAREQNIRIQRSGVRMMRDEETRLVDIDVTPIDSGRSRERFYLVLFSPSTGPAPAPPPADPATASAAQIEHLRQDLRSTRGTLQSIIERHEVTNQELRAANEEVQSSNEELQSTNEEPETAKEELQSTNEELTTVNEEPHGRQLELIQVNNDLQNLITSVHLSIIILGQDLRIRRFTPMAQKVLNVVPTDIGRPLSDINIKLAVSDLPQLIVDVMESLTVRELDVQDARGSWHSLRLRPYKSAENKIEGVVLTLIDIDANDAFYALFDLSREQAENRSFFDVVHGPDGLNDFRKVLLVLLPSRGSLTTERVYIDLPTLGSTEFLFAPYIEWNKDLSLVSDHLFTNLKDANPDSFYDKDLTSLTKEELVDNLRELQCRAPDASSAAIDRLQQTVQQLEVHRVQLEMQNRALRETQQELEHSARRYSDLFDHLPTGYLIVSIQGQTIGANPAAMELLDQSKGEVVGKFFRRFLDAYDAGRFAAHLEGCAASGRQSILELTLRRSNGSNVAVQLSSRFAPSLPGVERHIHIAVADVSQLKRTQRMLEEINREQETFNYSISHDLRSPLVTISNYARIVLSDHHEALDEEGAGMLHRIENAAMRMEETLRHLLEYSMLAREELVMQALDLNEVLSDVLVEHRGMIQQVRADVIVSPSLPPVRGSRVILGQVLANLLTNALKYTQPGVAPRVEIGAKESANGVVIHVRDHGIGIEEKFHARIFEIFERLHGYTKYPGSGVGLAIARRAVERMNGRIWLESTPGLGSTFYIELVRG